MRNRIHAVDKRLPNSVQALWRSDERIKRARKNTIAQLNHDDAPNVSEDNRANFNIAGNSSDIDAVFRARGTKNMAREPSASAVDGRPTQHVSDTALRLTVANADLSLATFDDVNLSGVAIRNARLTGAFIADADLSGSRWMDVNLTDVQIEDAVIDGLTINGIAANTLVALPEVKASVRRAVFESVSPIGDSDPMALPVKDVNAAVAYYVNVFGFEPITMASDRATLRRDSVEIGLCVNGHDPDQASIYFAVSDVESLHHELTALRASPSALRVDSFGDHSYRNCFAKEPYGVCFCFGQKIVTS